MSRSDCVPQVGRGVSSAAGVRASRGVPALVETALHHDDVRRGSPTARSTRSSKVLPPPRPGVAAAADAEAVVVPAELLGGEDGVAAAGRSRRSPAVHESPRNVTTGGCPPPPGRPRRDARRRGRLGHRLDDPPRRRARPPPSGQERAAESTDDRPPTTGGASAPVPCGRRVGSFVTAPSGEITLKGAVPPRSRGERCGPRHSTDHGSDDRRSAWRGSSSATHSTCAVIGKASNPRTPASRYPAAPNAATSRASAAGSQAT